MQEPLLKQKLREEMLLGITSSKDPSKLYNVSICSVREWRKPPANAVFTEIFFRYERQIMME